jgi:hypothetical protein
LALLIALAVALVHRGSPESRDGHDEMMGRLATIQARVEALSEPKASS